MGTVSLEQRFTVLASLGQNIDWDSLTTEQVQVGVREAQRAGAEATVFIRNGYRVQIGDFFRTMENLAIQIPALPRPTLGELRAKYSFIKSIERDTSPTEAVTLSLGTVLRPDEERIDGAEYERRIVPKLADLFGYQQLEWLVAHQDKYPAFKALLGQIYIDGPGIVVVGAGGHRLFPYLYENGKRWYLHWYWIEDDLDRYGRLASSGK